MVPCMKERQNIFKLRLRILYASFSHKKKLTQRDNTNNRHYLWVYDVCLYQRQPLRRVHTVRLRGQRRPKAEIDGN